ncbi:hypothetical protein N431DRAFT_459827 [Stipitochalara longipes BDJ]|nr:hypothetical protein N431DRAFT_459827 [Stipitochalara longipes BDJ]
MSFPIRSNTGNRSAVLAATVTQGIAGLLVKLITLPYYRFFNFNTLQPIQHIGQQTIQRESLTVILASLTRWRERKAEELQFISIACVTITAIITASFSWNTVASAHWTAPGFWYASLTFALCGVLLAAQQVTALSLLGPLPKNSSPAVSYKAILRYLPQMLVRTSVAPLDPEGRDSDYDLGEWTVRWKMVFTWQIPMMFTGYSFLCYIIGLTILACTPLIQRQPWGPESNIAIGYLATFGAGWAIFIYCSLWGYDKMDLDVEYWTEEGNSTPAAVPKGEGSRM